MFLALAVLLVAAGDLYERVRRFVRPDAAVGGVELALAFLVALALGAGSVALYLAATPAVYEETELWGAALALAAVGAIVAILECPTVARVLWAGLLATLAVNTRASVGLGPIVALGTLAVASGAGLLASRARVAALVAGFGPPGPARRGVLIALVVATLVPIATSAAVNQAKFDRPFGLPMDKQVATRLDANRRAALAANDGTIFGPQFIPTTLLAVTRPDAVGGLRAFPFVGLPAGLPHIVGDVRFDTLQRSLSAPTSMPLLCLLTLLALAGLVRRARLRPLLAVLVATATGYVGALTIAYVTTRYLTDLIPFLTLGALVGLQLLLAGGAWAGAAGRRERDGRRRAGGERRGRPRRPAPGEPAVLGARPRGLRRRPGRCGSLPRSPPGRCANRRAPAGAGARSSGRPRRPGPLRWPVHRELVGTVALDRAHGGYGVPPAAPARSGGAGRAHSRC